VFLGEVKKGPIQLLEIKVATNMSWGEKKLKEPQEGDTRVRVRKCRCE
jgi:hypothetical protein